MNARFLMRIIAPTITISMLLFGLGVVAAWNVQRQQAVDSDVVSLEVDNILAAQDLLLLVPDLRHFLQQYLRTGEPENLTQAAELEPRINEHLRRMHELARTPEEKSIIGSLEVGCQLFFSDLKHVLQLEGPAARRSDVGNLLDDVLAHRILQSAAAFVDANRQAVERTNEANRRTAEQMRQAFLLLGVCGGAAGLVAGLAIARGIGRSMLNLNVSVRGAADKLGEVVGPVRISGFDGLHDLESGLKEVEDHIATVVERLQQRELESLRNQQLAAVGQLAAGLAHELRNPLMPMKMLVQKALSRPDEAGMTRRQLQVLDEEIRRLESLIQEFVDFARPQELQRKIVDLLRVIEQAVELVSARAGIQQVQLATHFPPEQIEILADPQRIRQVLLNLLLNSLDEQPKGGEIIVEVTSETVTDFAGHKVIIKVADRGPGIEEELLQRIFEPFVSTKETGTGLGLTICQRIIENHGGTLHALNRPAGGAVFEIVLPQATDEMHAFVPVTTTSQEH